MVSQADFIRSIYEGELGQPQGATQSGIDYWAGTGLTGIDLIKTMRYAAGLDNKAYDDPAYSAFARSLVTKRAELGADRAARLAQIARARALATGTADENLSKQIERTNQDFEARGMFSSGGRLKSLSDVRRADALARTAQDESFNNQQEDITRQTDSALGDLSRQRDEQEVAARDRLTQRSIAKALGG